MIFGENLILNDDTFVGVQYRIPTFFDSFSRLSLTRQRWSDFKILIRLLKQIKSNAATALRLHERAICDISPTIKVAKKQEKSFVSFSGVHQCDHTVALSVIRNSKSVVFCANSDFGVTSVDSSVCSGVFRVSFGLVVFDTEYTFDDFSFDAFVFGDGLMDTVPTVASTGVVRDIKKVDTGTALRLDMTKSAVCVTEVSSSDEKGADFAGVVMDTENERSDHNIRSATRQVARFFYVMSKHVTKHTIMHDFLSASSVNLSRVQTTALLSRVGRLACYITDGFIFSDSVFDDFAFGEAIERVYGDYVIPVVIREIRRVDDISTPDVIRRQSSDVVSDTASSTRKTIFNVLDSIALGLPVNPLETPYLIPNDTVFEYGNTGSFVFFTKEYDINSDSYQPTLGFHHRCVVTDLAFNPVIEVGCSEYQDRCSWVVHVPTERLEVGKQYYAAFTWRINGSFKIQRVKFKVAMDVVTMKHARNE